MGLELLFGVEKVAPTTISPKPPTVTPALGSLPIATANPRPIDREPLFGKTLLVEFVKTIVLVEIPEDVASAMTIVPAEPEINLFSAVFSK